MIVWYLWFVITITDGHLRHYPVEGSYETEALCDEAKPAFLKIVKEMFPDDTNTRVYCAPFTPQGEPL